MATLQSSLSNSFTMYNRSVYRKNADHIFWFSMCKTSLGKNAQPTRRSTGRTSHPRKLFLLAGEQSGWVVLSSLPLGEEAQVGPGMDPLPR
jgi:hypothetical protein